MYIQNPYRFGADGYLLDTYNNSVIGLSLQKLSSSITYGIRVVRLSDNAETDVELYDSDSIDKSSTVSAGGDLDTWRSSSKVIITKFYDQSGNGNDVSTTTQAYMPVLIDSGGTLVVDNGKTAAEFVGTSNRMFTSGTLTELNDGNDITVFAVGAVSTGGIFGFYATGTGNRLEIAFDTRSQKRNGFVVSSGSAFADLSAQDTTQTQRILSNIIDGTAKDISAWRDDITGGQNQVWTGTYTNDQFNLACGNVAGNGFRGFFTELVLFSEKKTTDRPTIVTHMNNRYSTF